MRTTVGTRPDVRIDAPLEPLSPQARTFHRYAALPFLVSDQCLYSICRAQADESNKPPAGARRSSCCGYAEIDYNSSYTAITLKHCQPCDRLA
jgi:hypothetical protein